MDPSRELCGCVFCWGMGVEKFSRRNWIYVLKSLISGTSMAMAMDVPRIWKRRRVSTWRDSVGLQHLMISKKD